MEDRRADPAVEVAAVVTDESSVALVHGVVEDDTALVVVPATMEDAAATSESNQRKKVNQRWVLSDEAKRALEAVYNERRFPTLAMREELAQDLGGSLRQVQVWFQNRRQRDHRPDNEATLNTTAMAVGGSVQQMWGFMPGHPYPLGAIPMPSMQAHPLRTFPMFRQSAGGASAFSVQHGPQYPGGLTPGPGGLAPQLSHPILSMNNHLYQALAQRPPSSSAAASWTAQQGSTAALMGPQPSHPQCLHPPSVMTSLPPLSSLSSPAPLQPGQPRTALGTALASPQLSARDNATSQTSATSPLAPNIRGSTIY